VVQETAQPCEAAAAAPEAAGRVLLVDDSRAQRRMLRLLLERWGYEVMEAGSGEQALSLLGEEAVDVIVSDWMMPGLSGPELCRRFRRLERDGYGYFILLTSKSGNGEIVQGLEAGADDFVSKPVTAGELRARLAAGARVLGMERELRDKNAVIASALEELRDVYDAIDRDLMQARRIQGSLLPERCSRFGDSADSMLLRPCGHVGGDLVGRFVPGPQRLGFYGIDVSGHGVTSALMTARLAGYLSGEDPDMNIALERRFDRFHAFRPLGEVAGALNRRLLRDRGVSEYFTMAFAAADLRTGWVEILQAGHPHPALIRRDGRIDFLGDGGTPIGLLPGMEWRPFSVRMVPGERLLFYSDGFLEARGRDGPLGEDGIVRLIRAAVELEGCEFLDMLFRQLTGEMSAEALDDDVSAVLFEYGGPAP